MKFTGRYAYLAKGFVTAGFCFLFFGFGMASAANLKIAYINSQEIFEGFKGTKELQGKYEGEIAKWYDRLNKKEKEIKDLKDKLENRSLLMSKDAKERLQNEIKRKTIEYQKFASETFGRGGKAFAKNEEYTKPILAKIREILKVIRADEGYDFIFDTAAGAIVEAKPEYNLTEKVLKKLNAQHK